MIMLAQCCSFLWIGFTVRKVKGTFEILLDNIKKKKKNKLFCDECQMKYVRCPSLQSKNTTALLEIVSGKYSLQNNCTKLSSDFH